MATTQIHFDISESILQSLNQNKEEFTQQTRLFTALELFKNHKRTFGQAVELAGVDKRRFLVELDKHKFDLIDYDSSELEKELESF